MILGVVAVDLLESQVDRHPLSSRLENSELLVTVGLLVLRV